jgi:hypothetical protein
VFPDIREDWGPVQSRFALSGNGLVLADDRRVLRDLRGPGGLERHPSLWVVLAAHDEEWSVAEGVGSMLAREYLGEVEVIASNDLSADRTGEILSHLDLLTRLPSQILGGRDAVVVCFASPYRRLHLDLRHAQICLHHDGPRGRRVAGDTLPPRVVEGQTCDPAMETRRPNTQAVMAG